MSEKTKFSILTVSICAGCQLYFKGLACGSSEIGSIFFQFLSSYLSVQVDLFIVNVITTFRTLVFSAIVFMIQY